jgi:hypothetical protein
MKRRDLLKLVALAGASALVPAGLSEVNAGPGGHAGPYWITLQAGWGWDPTLFCDPKGAPINASYNATEIGKAGAISYAPSSDNELFFNKYASRLCVINGIELATHQMDAAFRQMWTGALQPGYPSLAALLAAALGEGAPMPLISAGGFEETAGLVPRTRLVGAQPLDWESLMTPKPNMDSLFSSMTETRIAQYRRERLKARRAAMAPPRIAEVLKMAEAAEMSRPKLEEWKSYWPSPLADDTSRALIQLVLAAFRAKLAVSANLWWMLDPGLTDASQAENYKDWTARFNMLMEEVQGVGLESSVIIVASSGGGRTPMYLDEEMKGHWSTGSMLLLGPGVPGNRVIGGTDENLRGISLDPSTLQPSSSGVRLRPAHVHRALRRLAGIDESTAAQRFPLEAEDLPLFS